jgi:DNA-binding PadR family transcriptional regulator
MKGQRDIPTLGYALLGLLSRQPSSGYDLRKIFATTPLGTFSDSPGAIYPALRRLEERGLVRSTVEERSGLRRRKVFRATSPGSAALRAWVDMPVTQKEVIRDLEGLFLRFSFMEPVLGRAGCARFLKSLARELESYIPSLREQMALLRAKLSLSGWLALECGIRGYEAQLSWTRYALSVLARKSNRNPRRRSSSSPRRQRSS